MAEQKRHDLFEFMRQISIEMSAEYNRIQMRATEDPGTAGDQGEENWRKLLEEWLPPTYKVCTKGRIISQEGVTSPQVDVVVLKSAYPRKLLDKKLYLSAGVAAAFECKTTLKASHIPEAVQNCVTIKSLYANRTGTPYKELHSPIVYGLLAHSHSWKGESSTPEENIERTLQEVDKLRVTHPRLQLDLVCVADLAAWASAKFTFFGPRPGLDWSRVARFFGPVGSAQSSYVRFMRKDEQQIEQFTPIGALISYISRRLAWEDPCLRDLADYYRMTKIEGPPRGCMRLWASSIYSDGVRSRVEGGLLSPIGQWDEWSCAFL
jgi:hypothetical protein